MFQYDAFLSYSHVRGHRLAAAVERTLEELGKAWDERKVLNVFRDVSKQGVTSDLTADLLSRLDASRYLVLLASPEAAGSLWVTKETKHWLATKELDTILLVLVAGNIVWNSAAGRFDKALTTALPDVLLEKYDAEPKWVDLRWTSNEEPLGVENDRFANCIADLSAVIMARSKDEIFGTQLREHYKAKARLIAEHATSLVPYDADLALLLAAASVDLCDVPETRRSLVQVLEVTADLVKVFGEGRVVVHSMALDPAGSKLLFGCRDGTIYEWSPAVCRGRVAPLACSAPVTSLAFSEDGAAFAIACEDGRVLAATAEYALLGEFQGSPADLVALDKVAKKLATAKEDHDLYSTSVQIWDVESGKKTASVVVDDYILNHLCFEGDKLKLFTAGGLLTLDALSGIEVSRSYLPRLMRSGPMAYSFDGRLGAMAQFDGGAVSLFEIANGNVDEDRLPLLEGPAGIAECVAISGSSDHIAVALAGGGRLTVWSVNGPTPTASTCRGLPRDVSQLAIAPAAAFVAALGRDRAEIRYPGRRSRLGRTLPVPVAELPSVILGVGDVAFSPCGRLVAWITHPSGGREGAYSTGETIAIWETFGHQKIASIASGSAYQVAFADESKLLVLDLNGEISAWNVTTGDRVSDQSRPVVDVNADGHLFRLTRTPRHGVVLIKYSDDAITLGDPLSEQKQNKFRAHEVIDIVANGNCFVSTDSRGEIQVWDVDNGVKFQQSCPVANPYLLRTFLSEDGRFLAIVSANDDVSVYDVEAGVRTIEFAAPPVSDAAITADGVTLFILAPDGKLTAFDLSNGLISASVQGTSETPWGRLVLAPGGCVLAELIAGGGLTLWNMDPKSWRTLARQVAGRSLSDAERRRFGLGTAARA